MTSFAVAPMVLEYLLFASCFVVIATSASANRSIRRATRDLDPLIINPDLARAESKAFWNSIAGAGVLCLALLFTRSAQDDTRRAERDAEVLHQRIVAVLNAPPIELAPAAPVPPPAGATTEVPASTHPAAALTPHAAPAEAAIKISLGPTARILLHATPAGAAKAKLPAGTAAFLTGTPPIERAGRRWTEIRMSLDGPPAGWVVSDAIHVFEG